MTYHRSTFDALKLRLREAPTRLQIVAGPRQVGKTTLVRQLLSPLERPVGSYRYLAADGVDDPYAAVDSMAGSAFAPGRPRGQEWLVEQWAQATVAAANWGRSESAVTRPFVLAIDEIQRIDGWSVAIKGLWDALHASPVHMHVVLLGSSPLLMQKGLSESLAGRFEVTRLTHWSFEEMNSAFGFDLDEYIFFGGFPGSAAWISDEPRWRDYVNLSLIRPNIDIDILAMTRVDKPALLRQLFELGCLYSGQIVALDKLLGTLNDAGNVTTLARYLELLADAGLLAGLQKQSDGAIRRRRAPPKLQAMNGALVSAQGAHSFAQARADRSHWGRLVESAFGAHLLNTAGADMAVRYWRDGVLEVDFVIEHHGRLAAIEVKSAPRSLRHAGLEEFSRRHPGCKTWQVGGDALPIGEALRRPAAEWLE